MPPEGDGLVIEIALSEHIQIFVCSHSEMNSCSSILPQLPPPLVPLVHSLKYSERGSESMQSIPFSQLFVVFLFLLTTPQGLIFD